MCSPRPVTRQRRAPQQVQAFGFAVAHVRSSTARGSDQSDCKNMANTAATLADGAAKAQRAAPVVRRRRGHPSPPTHAPTGGRGAAQVWKAGATCNAAGDGGVLWLGAARQGRGYTHAPGSAAWPHARTRRGGWRGRTGRRGAAAGGRSRPAAPALSGREGVCRGRLFSPAAPGWLAGRSHRGR